MKQRDLIKKLEAAGFIFERHGGIMIYTDVGMTRKRFRGIKK